MVAGSIDSLANVYGGALPFTGGVNFANNYQAILVGSFFTALSYKITKKILRKPINKINTKIFGKRGLIGPIGFKL